MPATGTSFATIITAAATIVAAVIFFGAIVLSIIMFRRWRGPWRYAAGFPLLALASLAAVIFVGIMRDPTAHNLWPFEFVIWGIASLIYLGLLSLVRRFFK